MESSNEPPPPPIDDESDDETPPEVLLAQERARLAQLREQRDELERKVAAAAAADAESYAASAAALRENVASIQVAADPAAAARLALKTKHATLREQSKELDRWKDLVAANRTGDVEALAALAACGDAGLAAAARRALPACRRLWTAEVAAAAAPAAGAQGGGGQGPRRKGPEEAARRRHGAPRRPRKLEGDAAGSRAAAALAAPVESRFSAFFLDEAAADDGDEEARGTARRDRPEWHADWLLRVWRASAPLLPPRDEAARAALRDAFAFCATWKLLEALPYVVRTPDTLAKYVDAYADLEEALRPSEPASPLARLAGDGDRLRAWRFAVPKPNIQPDFNAASACAASAAAARNAASAGLDDDVDVRPGASLVGFEVAGLLALLERRYGTVRGAARAQLLATARGAVAREIALWSAPRLDAVDGLLPVGWAPRKGLDPPDAWRRACAACHVCAHAAASCEAVVAVDVGDRPPPLLAPPPAAARPSLIGGGAVLKAGLGLVKRLRRKDGGHEAAAHAAAGLDDLAALGADARAALDGLADAFLRRVARLAHESRRKVVVDDRGRDRLGDAWLRGFLEQCAVAAAAARRSAGLATLEVDALLGAKHRRAALGGRIAALRDIFGDADDAAAALARSLGALHDLNGQRRRALLDAFAGLAPPDDANPRLEDSVAVADDAVQAQLAAMLEANGVDDLDPRAAARLLAVAD
ncbi:hypothetical protein JL722_7635 [Aureococcus anophagefferens]|nr:hypothetical protein JL722_7635 [Aureococcus anophagefferens]